MYEIFSTAEMSILYFHTVCYYTVLFESICPPYLVYTGINHTEMHIGHSCWTQFPVFFIFFSSTDASTAFTTDYISGAMFTC